MGLDDKTLAFYDAEASVYAERASKHVAEAPLSEFARALPTNGKILDFGCGPGWAAAQFKSQGFEVTAIDGSAGLAAQAKQLYDVDVVVAPFDSLTDEQTYDGIWASFCLLHDSRAAMPGHLGRLYRALRPDGVLYLGLKEGTTERRDRLGRHYTYFGQREIVDLLIAAGFTAPRVTAFMSLGMEGQEEPCLHIFANRG